MKAISKDLTSFTITPNSFAHIKSGGIYGNYKPNVIAPLVYFKKPKWVNQEDFERIVNSIKIELVMLEPLNQTKDEREQ